MPDFMILLSARNAARHPSRLVGANIQEEKTIIRMMKKIVLRDSIVEIRPITRDDLSAVLDVYRQCEDFLALGPVPAASMEMVLKDIDHSQAEGGIFCGIFISNGRMIGIIDYFPRCFEGNPQHAFLSLLMIAQPFRKQGIGKAIVTAIENEIKKDTGIKAILSGVQVNNPQAMRFWKNNGYKIVSGPKLMLDQTTVFDLRKDL